MSVAASDEQRRELEALVGDLDCLPLAIELCAARVGVFSVPELRTRLADRFNLLASRHRDVAPRHATLESAIESSWQELAEGEQQALTRCSLFCGGFTLEAAGAVLGGDAAERVERLCEASLAYTSVSGSGLRFHLYHSIRAFALERLDAAQGREAVAQHAAHYARHAQRCVAELHGRSPRAALEQLFVEQANLLAAFGWARRHARVEEAVQIALALHEMTITTGPMSLGREILDAAVELSARSGRSDLRCTILCARAEALRVGGQPAAALEDALEVIRAVGAGEGATNPVLLGMAHVEAGAAFRNMGEIREATKHTKQALEVYEGVADERLHALARLHQGANSRYLGQPREAIAHNEQGLELARRAGASHCQAKLLLDLGSCNALVGETDRAERAYERALKLCGQLVDRRVEAMVLGGLGTVAQLKGDFDRAEHLFDRADRLVHILGDAILAMWSLNSLASLRFERRELAEAETLLERALEGARAPSHAFLLADTLATLASVRAERDDVGGASDAASKARELLMDPTAKPPESMELLVAESFLSLARARRERTPAAAREELARVQACLERVAADPALSLRPGERMLRAARGRTEELLALEVLTLGPEAAWFSLAGGERVDLSHRRVLTRVLQALADAQRERPGVTVAIDRLVAIGWPDEKILPSAAKHRLRVAISTLRKLGLGDRLQQRGGGYLLDASVVVRGATNEATLTRGC